MHLEKFMNERGLTDQDLAAQVGCNPSTVTAWKKGVNFPRRAQLLRLRKVLRCSLDELIGLGKIPSDPIRRMAKRLHKEITMGGEFNSGSIHQIATQFRHYAGGRPTKLEKWLRGVAEVLYEAELLERKTDTGKQKKDPDFFQLRLF